MRTLLAGSILLVACGGSAPPPEAAAPAPPTRLTYQPATVTYEAVSHRDVEQDIQGRTMQNAIESRYVLQVEVAPATDGFDVTMVLDSLTISGQMNVALGEIDAARQARFTARLQPTGELTGFRGGDSTVALVNQVATTLRDFFPRIPPDGVTPGAVWVDTAESVTDVGGVLLNVVSVSRHEALDWRTHAGREALAIRTVSDYTLSGSGEQAGQELTLDGQGRRHALEYLTADGVYIGSTAADTSQFEVVLTRMGMVIPGAQHSADTIRAR